MPAPGPASGLWLPASLLGADREAALADALLREGVRAWDGGAVSRALFVGAGDAPARALAAVLVPVLRDALGVCFDVDVDAAAQRSNGDGGGVMSTARMKTAAVKQSSPGWQCPAPSSSDWWTGESCASCRAAERDGA